MPTLCQNSLGKMVKIYHSKDALGKVHSNLIILQIWNVKVMRELHCTVSHDLTKKLQSVELWSSSSLFFCSRFQNLVSYFSILCFQDQFRCSFWLGWISSNTTFLQQILSCSSLWIIPQEMIPNIAYVIKHGLLLFKIMLPIQKMHIPASLWRYFLPFASICSICPVQVQWFFVLIHEERSLLHLFWEEKSFATRGKSSKFKNIFIVPVIYINVLKSSHEYTFSL